MVRIRSKGLTLWSKSLATLALLAVIAVSSQTAAASSAVKLSTNDVLLISDGSAVPGAWSKLVRTDSSATMALRTSELPARNAITVWWVIFNSPENCVQSEGPFRCGASDLENPAVQPSVLYAAGSVSNSEGKGSFGSHLSAGDTRGCVTGLPCSGGLTNPMGADIHLIVRTHGPIIPAMLREQISTFGGGCNNVPPGTDEPGPNTCQDLQMSIHEQ